MLLIDTMIKGRRFKAFVDDLVNRHNTEEEERTMWEYWLHRIFDKSFADFMSEIKPNSKKTTTKQDTTTDWTKVVAESRDILNDFCLSE